MEHKEAFYILLLNNANEILGISRIGEGSVTGVMVDMRIIFQIALKAHAVGIILAHNHPSGTLRPSQADIKLTERIKLAGELFDIKVLDHIILTEHSYFSFADEHLL